MCSKAASWARKRLLHTPPGQIFQLYSSHEACKHEKACKTVVAKEGAAAFYLGSHDSLFKRLLISSKFVLAGTAAGHCC